MIDKKKIKGGEAGRWGGILWKGVKCSAINLDGMQSADLIVYNYFAQSKFKMVTKIVN